MPANYLTKQTTAARPCQDSDNDPLILPCFPYRPVIAFRRRWYSRSMSAWAV